MGKRKRLEKKKRSRVRERDWEANQDTAFTHDLARHRRALVKLPEHSLYNDPLPTDFKPNATVVTHSRKWAFVKMDTEPEEHPPGAEGTRLCLIDERLRETDESLLAPGDRVLVVPSEENYVVRSIAPRATKLTRYAGVHGRLKQKIIAANVDILVIVASAASPPFRPGLIDRFLIVARLGGVRPILCLNKTDLMDNEPEELRLYRALDLDICMTSCKTGAGVESLRARLAGKTSVLAGHSGVGKSSLLNQLDPNLRIVTREVSQATQRGRHATTAAVLYEMQSGIRIIDTPGIRSLGLWNVTPEEVAYYFPEIAAAGAGCKFRNCTHIHEVACTVKAAVEQGEITAQRYESYKRVRTCLETESAKAE